MDKLTEARAVLAPKRRVRSETLMTDSLTPEPPLDYRLVDEVCLSPTRLIHHSPITTHFNGTMKLFVTTFDLRPEAVRALAERDCDGIELRAETATVPVDLAALRAVTSKPLLLTYRAVRVDAARIARPLQAGITLLS